MSAKFSDGFLSNLSLISETWTKKSIATFMSTYESIEAKEEKEAILFIAVLLQLPIVSQRAVHILSKEYNSRFGSFPEKLPLTFFQSFFDILLRFDKKQTRIFSKLVVIMANSLSQNAIPTFIQFILKYPSFHQTQIIFPILLSRDPTIVSVILNDYTPGSACEKALSACLASIICPELKISQFQQIFLLFMNGTMSISSTLFSSFCFYVERIVNSINQPDSNNIEVSISHLIEAIFAKYPQIYDVVFKEICKTLSKDVLPYYTISTFFEKLYFPQIKAIHRLIIEKDGSIRSLHSLNRPGVYSDMYCVSLCARFVRTDYKSKVMNHIIPAMKNINNLFFENNVLSKIVDISSLYEENLQIIYDFLEALAKFSCIAKPLITTLQIFFTREKKRINELALHFIENPCSVVISLYLLGNSKLLSTKRFVSRYKSLVKASVSKFDFSHFTVNTKLPKHLDEYLQKHKSVISEKVITTYLNDIADHQIPIEFDVEEAFKLIDQFQPPPVMKPRAKTIQAKEFNKTKEKSEPELKACVKTQDSFGTLSDSLIPQPIRRKYDYSDTCNDYGVDDEYSYEEDDIEENSTASDFGSLSDAF